MRTKWMQFYAVESDSLPGKYYTVAKTDEGEWGCSCPRWIYHREKCKHIRRLLSTTASKYTVDLAQVPAEEQQFTRQEILARSLKSLPPTVRPQMEKAISRFSNVEVI